MPAGTGVFYPLSAQIKSPKRRGRIVVVSSPFPPIRGHALPGTVKAPPANSLDDPEAAKQTEEPCVIGAQGEQQKQQQHGVTRGGLVCEGGGIEESTGLPGLEDGRRLLQAGNSSFETQQQQLQCGGGDTPRAVQQQDFQGRVNHGVKEHSPMDGSTASVAHQPPPSCWQSQQSQLPYEPIYLCSLPMITPEFLQSPERLQVVGDQRNVAVTAMAVGGGSVEEASSQEVTALLMQCTLKDTSEEAAAATGVTIGKSKGAQSQPPPPLQQQQQQQAHKGEQQQQQLQGPVEGHASVGEAEEAAGQLANPHEQLEQCQSGCSVLRQPHDEQRQEHQHQQQLQYVLRGQQLPGREHYPQCEYSRLDAVYYQQVQQSAWLSVMAHEGQEWHQRQQEQHWRQNEQQQVDQHRRSELEWHEQQAQQQFRTQQQRAAGGVEGRWGAWEEGYRQRSQGQDQPSQMQHSSGQPPPPWSSSTGPWQAWQEPVGEMPCRHGQGVAVIPQLHPSPPQSLAVAAGSGGGYGVMGASRYCGLLSGDSGEAAGTKGSPEVERVEGMAVGLGQVDKYGRSVASQRNASVPQPAIPSLAHLVQSPSQPFRRPPQPPPPPPPSHSPVRPVQLQGSPALQAQQPPPPAYRMGHTAVDQWQERGPAQQQQQQQGQARAIAGGTQGYVSSYSSSGWSTVATDTSSNTGANQSAADGEDGRRYRHQPLIRNNTADAADESTVQCSSRGSAVIASRSQNTSKEPRDSQERGGHLPTAAADNISGAYDGPREACRVGGGAWVFVDREEVNAGGLGSVMVKGAAGLSGRSARHDPATIESPDGAQAAAAG